MTVLDAYAVIAFLRGETAAAQVRQLLSAGDAVLTAVGLAEVIDHLVRLARADEETVMLDLAQLGLLESLPVTAELAASAGLLRAQHYHRTRCAVSMADCLAAEAARSAASPLATADPHLLAVCHSEGIPVTALPDTAGRTWCAPD